MGRTNQEESFRQTIFFDIECHKLQRYFYQPEALQKCGSCQTKHSISRRSLQEEEREHLRIMRHSERKTTKLTSEQADWKISSLQRWENWKKVILKPAIIKSNELSMKEDILWGLSYQGVV